jgi:[NiFe] hydrogenase diaphorase moiety large subunit
MNDASIATICARHDFDAGQLLQILRAVQTREGWLPAATLDAIATCLKIPRAAVEATASFYSFLHLAPVGRYCILFSDNVTDRMLGSRELMESLCRQLWVEPGHLSEDGLVSVATTSCTGLCDQGPALLVNERALTRMDEPRIAALAEFVRNKVPLDQWPTAWFAVEDNLRLRGPLLNLAAPQGNALRAAFAMGPAGWLSEVRESGLRGRGGAGFPTARKWQACRDAESDARFVVCNADEGEPGTFKDRVLLTRYADAIFEGMTLAGYAVGARRGLLYLRGEYLYLLEPLEAVLRQRRAAGLLGETVLGGDFAFDIDIHVGAGAYVCGEETALIESLEGKPGRPRIRPPFPVTQGYRGHPTVVNNVETLVATCLIALHGGTAYAGQGTPGSTGSKLISVSGDCAAPGIYEFPLGVTLRAVLEACGGHDAQAVQVSGPSGMLLAQSAFDRRIAFEDVPCAGAFMVFGRQRDLFEMVRNFAHFFAHESCGFCTPCRVGTRLIAKLLDKIACGHGSPYDLNELAQLCEVTQATSHCGLGSSAGNPVRDALRQFRPAFERRLRSLDYAPAFDLDAALAQARQMTGRQDSGAHLRGATE